MQIHGVIPVIPTPFRPDDGIDEESLRRTVDFAIAGGACAICAPAFGSEYYKLDDAERRQIVEIVAGQTAGRVPVFASASAGSVASTVEFSRHAESCGAQGIMIAPPRAVPLGAHELTSFFEAVCGSIKIPVMFQDADFASSGLSVDFFMEAAKRSPNLKFLKLENVLPGERCREILRRSQGQLQVLYGWGGLRLFDGLAHGATGVMPGTGLVDIYVRIIRLYEQGRVTESKALFYRLLPFLVFAVEHLELFIRMEKRVLMKRGVIASDRLREPTLHLDDLYEEQMEELVDLGIRLAQEP